MVHASQDLKLEPLIKSLKSPRPEIDYFKFRSYFAATKDGGIGLNNNLPWRIKADLKQFKLKTTNNIVIMGRSTYESIGMNLPNRVSVVVHSKPLEVHKVVPPSSALVSVETIEEAFIFSQKMINETNVTAYLIGGRSIIEYALDHCELNDITTVTKDNDEPIECDVFITDYKQRLSKFELCSCETVKEDPYTIDIGLYVRKKLN